MNKADIHRPEGVAAQLRVSGGAAGLTLDGSSLAGLAGETRLRTADYGDGTSRLRLRGPGGAARLTVDTGAPPSATGPVSTDIPSQFLDGLERRLSP